MLGVGRSAKATTVAWHGWLRVSPRLPQLRPMFLVPIVVPTSCTLSRRRRLPHPAITPYPSGLTCVSDAEIITRCSSSNVLFNPSCSNKAVHIALRDRSSPFASESAAYTAMPLFFKIDQILKGCKSTYTVVKKLYRAVEPYISLYKTYT
jgi:hypothetical protein